MHNESSAEGPQGNFETMTLADLVELTMETRASHIAKEGGDAIRAAGVHLHREGMSVPEGFEARLAWAIADNLDGGKSSIQLSDAPIHRNRSSYLKTWSPTTPFTHLWSNFASPVKRNRHNAGPPRIRMSELGASVLCEQNESWQDPPSRPITKKDAEEAKKNAEDAFAWVYENNKPKVVGYLRWYIQQKLGGHLEGDLIDVTNEAWAQVVADYWSDNAHNRFLGLSRISTFVGQVARNIAVDIFHKQPPLPLVRDERGSPDEEEGNLRGFSLENIGVFMDPSDKISERQLKQKIYEGVEAIPSEKTKETAKMLWFGMMPGEETTPAKELGLDKKVVSGKETAKHSKVSKARISQRGKEAREMVRNYLQEHGYRVTDYKDRKTPL